MSEEKIKEILQEIKDESLINYIKEAEYSINQNSGNSIDYDKDLEARSLLKNYVLYANDKRLAEFKQLYCGEYAKLQAKYYGNT